MWKRSCSTKEKTRLNFPTSNAKRISTTTTKKNRSSFSPVREWCRAAFREACSKSGVRTTKTAWSSPATASTEHSRRTFWESQAKLKSQTKTTKTKPFECRSKWASKTSLFPRIVITATPKNSSKNYNPNTSFSSTEKEKKSND